MNILNKIRSLSKKKRTIILWVVMFMVVAFLLSAYTQNIKNTLEENEGNDFSDQFDFQEIQEEVNSAKEIIFDNINKGEK